LEAAGGNRRGSEGTVMSVRVGRAPLGLLRAGTERQNWRPRPGRASAAQSLVRFEG